MPPVLGVCLAAALPLLGGCAPAVTLQVVVSQPPPAPYQARVDARLTGALSGHVLDQGGACTIPGAPVPRASAADARLVPRGSWAVLLPTSLGDADAFLALVLPDGRGAVVQARGAAVFRLGEADLRPGSTASTWTATGGTVALDASGHAGRFDLRLGPAAAVPAGLPRAPDAAPNLRLFGTFACHSEAP